MRSHKRNVFDSDACQSRQFWSAGPRFQQALQPLLAAQKVAKPLFSFSIRETTSSPGLSCVTYPSLPNHSRRLAGQSFTIRRSPQATRGSEGTSSIGPLRRSISAARTVRQPRGGEIQCIREFVN